MTWSAHLRPAVFGPGVLATPGVRGLPGLGRRAGVARGGRRGPRRRHPGGDRGGRHLDCHARARILPRRRRHGAVGTRAARGLTRRVKAVMDPGGILNQAACTRECRPCRPVSRPNSFATRRSPAPTRCCGPACIAVLHRDLPDLRAARRRTRQPARAHLPDQGHAGIRPARERRRGAACRSLPVLPRLHDDLSVRRELHAPGRSRPAAHRGHLHPPLARPAAARRAGPRAALSAAHAACFARGDDGAAVPRPAAEGGIRAAAGRDARPGAATAAVPEPARRRACPPADGPRRGRVALLAGCCASR